MARFAFIFHLTTPTFSGKKLMSHLLFIKGIRLFLPFFLLVRYKCISSFYENVVQTSWSGWYDHVERCFRWSCRWKPKTSLKCWNYLRKYSIQHFTYELLFLIRVSLYWKKRCFNVLFFWKHSKPWTHQSIKNEFVFFLRISRMRLEARKCWWHSLARGMFTIYNGAKLALSSRPRKFLCSLVVALHRTAGKCTKL